MLIKLGGEAGELLTALAAEDGLNDPSKLIVELLIREDERRLITHLMPNGASIRHRCDRPGCTEPYATIHPNGAELPVNG